MPLNKLQPTAAAPANFWALFSSFWLFYCFFLCLLLRQGVLYLARALLFTVGISCWYLRTAELPHERPDVPHKLRRIRGCHAGASSRNRRICYRPVLPSVVMGNVRSHLNKMYELMALAWRQRDCHECNIMVFTVKWLTQNTGGLIGLISESSMRIEGGWWYLLMTDGVIWGTSL